MEKQDYLQRQIDQLGKVLGELLAKVAGGGKNPDASETLEAVNQTLDENLDLDIEKLLNIPEEYFIDKLIKNRLLNDLNLETLADLLGELAYHSYSHKNELLKRALLIYEHLEKSGKAFSFTRNQKIESIKQKLSQW